MLCGYEGKHNAHWMSGESTARLNKDELFRLRLLSEEQEEREKTH
jgi:hypothetical protein